MSRSNDAETQRWALLLLNEAQSANAAKNAGVNPGEYLYSKAKQLGYTVKDTHYEGAPPSAPSEADEKLSRLEKGMRDSAPTGGSAPDQSAPIDTVDGILNDFAADARRGYRS